MKARIIETDNVIKLLLVNGVIKNISFSELVEFLKTYHVNFHYAGDKTWDEQYEISMDEFTGNTLAIVTNEGDLLIRDPNLITRLMDFKQINYITVDEYAAKHNKKNAIIRRFCTNGRIKGAVQKGSRWLIPEDAEYPVKPQN